ncbi:hypothetical protein JCM10296v2_007247 [Rhodotorula toruloides]
MSLDSLSTVYAPLSCAAGLSQPGSLLLRRRIIVAVAAIVFVALTLSPPVRGWNASRLRETYLSDVALSPPTPGPGCALPSLLSARNNASFWQVKVLSSSTPSFAIQPSDYETYYNCPELALATFTVRLHFPNETHLVDCQPRQGPLGRYICSDLPAALYEPGRTTSAEVEALLEFGHFSGLASGQPCAAASCRDAVYLSLNSGTWSGKEIFALDGHRARLAGISSASLRQVDDPAPECTTLAVLSSALLVPARRFAYKAIAKKPCSLPELPSLAPLASQPKWIHLFGDSNFRHAIVSLAQLLGAGECTWATLPKEPYPTHTVCGNAGSDYIVTFAFVWFKGPRFGNVTDYDSEDLASLAQFIRGMPFAADLPAAITGAMLDIPMSHLFITTGSHAPQLSVQGMQASLDEYSDAFQRKIDQASATTFVAVPSVDPARIPTSYGNQAALRNNIMIQKQNEVQQRWVQSALDNHKVDYLDLFSMTRALPDAARRDSVHFEPFVYEEWAKLFAAAMELARRRQETTL